jgi:H+/Cl- antiporter ClcA
VQEQLLSVLFIELRQFTEHMLCLECMSLRDPYLIFHAIFFIITLTLKWFQCRYYKAFAAYAGCNVVLAAAAAVLCAFIAPAAAGSGIPEVKAYLNGVDAYSMLAPSTLFVKVNGRLCSLSLLT